MTDVATEQLAQKMRGRVLRSGDPGFEDARRLWNGMIDRSPTVIVQCEGAADVVAALDFARGNELPVTVRGGGHGVAGKAVCEGGCMIDLSAMDEVHVDASRRRVRVGPGARWGQVDHETQAFGLATTGGVDSRTGVAGLTLGGGVGWLARSCGLSVDNLVSAEVVLADGRTVTASAHEHPELWWGLRGGGGNFGIVTSFELQLHEVGPEIMVAQVFYPLEQAEQVLRAYRDYTAALADTTSCYALFVPTPPADPFPEERHGTTALALVACHNGPLEEGEEQLAAVTSFGDPLLSVLAPMPYTALQQAFDAGAPDGGRYYWKAQYLNELSDEFIETLANGVETLPGPFSNVFIEQMGGAIARPSAAATAYPHRDVRYGLGISSGWADPAQDHEAIRWTRDLDAALRPFGAGAVYVNYLDADEDDRVSAAYRHNLERLQHVKGTYDPDNVFRQNANVVPAGVTAT